MTVTSLYFDFDEKKGYTCSSRTMEHRPLSSALNVSGEHFRSRSKPTRISTKNNEIKTLNVLNITSLKLLKIHNLFLNLYSQCVG